MVVAVAGELATVLVSLLDELALVLVSLFDEIALVLAGPLDELGLNFLGGYGVLAHPVRQKVLALLADDDSLTRTELAEAAARDEDVPYESVERLEVVLHHNHLPKLEDRQYVEYDARNGDVVLWDDPETVRSLLNTE